MGLWKGAMPTTIGYAMQGACKFGFYEFFKHYYCELIGQEKAEKYKTSIYLSASASAELIADVALSPMEALKVRVQTSKNPEYSVRSSLAFKNMLRNEGVLSLYSGLIPLWLRQIPYTMMKFAAFERSVESMYKYVLVGSKEDYTKVQQLGVSFLGGYWAGIFCAVVSHPADTVVSKLNSIKRPKGHTAFQTIRLILNDLGFRGVWTGIGTRIIMIGTLTAMQWFIYDTFKVYAGLPTSGSSGNKNHRL